MRVLILGAGGHAQIVADILLRSHDAGSRAVPIGYLDDDPQLLDKTFLGLPVLGPLSHLAAVEQDAVIVAIGDNTIRRQLFEQLRQQGECFATAIHPRAILAPNAQVGPGTMICAGVVVNTGSVIGANVILNTGCTVDHHNRIGDHAHIAPGVHLGGEVTIGEGTLIGIGATVMPCCRIGAWSVVGAAALVHHDLPAYVTAVGVPAQVVGRNTNREKEQVYANPYVLT